MTMEIKCWDDVEKAFIKIEKLHCDKDGKIEAAKRAGARVMSKAKEKVKPWDKEREELEEAIEKFVRENKADLAPLKSRKFPQGEIGFSDRVKFSWPKKVETLLARIKERGLAKYIRTKEEPDKKGISAHWDRLFPTGMEDKPEARVELRDLGVSRKTTHDVFFCRLNVEKEEGEE